MVPISGLKSAIWQASQSSPSWEGRESCCWVSVKVNINLRGGKAQLSQVNPVHVKRSMSRMLYLLSVLIKQSGIWKYGEVGAWSCSCFITFKRGQELLQYPTSPWRVKCCAYQQVLLRDESCSCLVKCEESRPVHVR